MTIDPLILEGDIFGKRVGNTERPGSPSVDNICPQEVASSIRFSWKYNREKLLVLGVMSF